MRRSELFYSGIQTNNANIVFRCTKIYFGNTVCVYIYTSPSFIQLLRAGKLMLAVLAEQPSYFLNGSNVRGKGIMK